MNPAEKKQYALDLIGKIQRNEELKQKAARKLATSVGGSKQYRAAKEKLDLHTSKAGQGYRLLTNIVSDLPGEAPTPSPSEREKKLEAALRPFADEAAHWDGWDGDEKIVEPFGSYEGNLLVKHLWAADALLSDTEGE